MHVGSSSKRWLPARIASSFDKLCILSFQSDVMFAGELASLQAIEATSAIRVPHPIGAFSLGCHGEALVTEYLDMSGSRRDFSAQLGRNLAK